MCACNLKNNCVLPELLYSVVCCSDRATREGSEDGRSVPSSITPEAEAVLSVINPCKHLFSPHKKKVTFVNS